MTETKGIQNIHGKEYETVPYRVHKFRGEYKVLDEWAIVTEIVEHDRHDGFVLMRAVVISPSGRAVGVGHAAESRNEGKINRTSYVENCETSAIGRALAACGLGGESYCSAEEVETAIENQAAGVVTGAKNEPELVNYEQYTTENRDWARDVMVDKWGEVKAREKHNEFLQQCQTPGEYVDAWEELKYDNKNRYIKYMVECAKALQEAPEQPF